MKVNAALDLLKNELQNAVIQNLVGAPSSPKVGQVYEDTSGGSGNEVFYQYIGSGWVEIAYMFRVLAKRLDQFAAPTSSLNINNQKLINVADPMNAQDGATKAYVDMLVNGTDWKNSVRVGTTANITLSGLQTIDGVAVNSGDRVAVKNQTAAETNGLYTASAGVWSRTPDADSSAEVTPNLSFFIEEGTTQADTQWRLTTNAPIVLGSTALTFTQIGAVISYLAGAGLLLTGNTFSVDRSIISGKYSATFGDGAALSFTIDHNLNNAAPAVTFKKTSNGEPYIFDYTVTNANRIIITAPTAPASNEFTVGVIA